MSAASGKEGHENGSAIAEKTKDSEDAVSFVSTESSDENVDTQAPAKAKGLFRPLSQPGRPPRREPGEDLPNCRWSNCREVFPSAAAARAHEQHHSYNIDDVQDGKGFTCKIKDCGKVFGCIKVMRKHLSYHQPPSLACDKCGKKFHETAKLKRHESVHMGRKNFVCQECGRDFSFKANLKTHMRVHSGERPFACTVPGCGRRFAQASNRNAHVLTHTKKGEDETAAAPLVMTESTPAVDNKSKRRKMESLPKEEPSTDASAVFIIDPLSAARSFSFTVPASSSAQGNMSAFRSASPYLIGTSLTFGTTQFVGLQSPPPQLPISAHATPKAFSPIPMPTTAPTTLGKAAELGEKSGLHQLANLSSEVWDRSTSQSPMNLTGMTPTSLNSSQFLTGGTPLGIQPKTSSSSSSGTFSDQSILFSSLNNSLGSASSNGTRWAGPQETDRGQLTPQLGLRFTPDVLK